MAETVFTNLRVRGTLTLVGLTTLVTAVITTLTVTNLTVTTGNFTTANITTLSGTTITATEAGDLIEGRTLSGLTITATNPGGLIEATTVSGATLTTTAGDTVINSSGIETLDTISGSLIRAVTALSGAKVTVNAIGVGSGNLSIGGTKGANICMRDSDNAGNTVCYALDGAFICAITTNACP